MFTNRLAEMAAGLGVKFRWNTRIEALQVGGGAITGVHTDAGLLTADKVVLALGSHSPQLLAPVGIRIPVYPVKGYSITVPITDAQYAPESTIMDETHKVAVTRLGDRIRVGGTAELAGYSLNLREPRRAHAEPRRHRPFPQGRRHQQGQLLVRPAPHDARWHAHRRPHAGAEPAAGHRPRHAGLDHGGRHRARDRRPHQRQAARHRRQRPGDVALPVVAGAVPPPLDIGLHHLSAQPQWRREAAALIHEEFWLTVPGASEDGMFERLGQAAHADRLPLCLLALHQGPHQVHLAGVVNLVDNDDDEHADWHPWLAGMVVAEPFRGRGVGSALVRGLLSEAWKLGFERVHFGTDGPGFYTRLGALYHLQPRPGFWFMRFERPAAP